jgi:agmatinase
MSSASPGFDPNAAAPPDSGIFGLPDTFDEAQVVLVPVPFDATTSYQSGAALGPAAIMRASKQVDLHDHHFGPVYQYGVYMEEEPASLVQLFGRARALAEPIISKGGAEEEDAQAIAEIAKVGSDVNDLTYGAFAALLYQGKSPGLLGGDHSTPFGAIRACADLAEALDPRGGLGILHLDAHMDMREAFEGFEWSHASIMYNVLASIPEVHKLVQIGIRDYSEGEIDAAKRFGKRIQTNFDGDWAAKMLGGERFTNLAKRAIASLPQYVYVSFDIDALDPALCPHTGTPVPGGLSFNQAALILRMLADSGRTVLGFDLVEVAPGRCTNEPEIDANVGARILYKLCGLVGERKLAKGRITALTARSNGRLAPASRQSRRSPGRRPARRR